MTGVEKRLAQYVSPLPTTHFGFIPGILGTPFDGVRRTQQPQTRL
jgi:hypothetical protein